MTTEQTRTLVNGEKTESISVADRGLQFGDGVFETIRMHLGKPVWWQQHIDRLLDGCNRLRFSELPDTEVLQQEANALAMDCDAGVLKIIITRGCSNSGYVAPTEIPCNRILSLTPGMRRKSKAGQGIILGICQQRLPAIDTLSSIKHLNRLEQVLARLQCRVEGWDEGIMIDDQENVIEGSMSNLFIWQGDQLITPSLEKTGLKGLCRESVLSLAKENRISVKQSNLKLSDLENCSSLFMTNSLIGIWPVINFNSKLFPVCENTRLLQNKLENAICSAE